MGLNKHSKELNQVNKGKFSQYSSFILHQVYFNMRIFENNIHSTKKNHDI